MSPFSWKALQKSIKMCFSNRRLLLKKMHRILVNCKQKPAAEIRSISMIIKQERRWNSKIIKMPLENFRWRVTKEDVMGMAEGTVHILTIFLRFSFLEKPWTMRFVLLAKLSFFCCTFFFSLQISSTYPNIYLKVPLKSNTRDSIISQ